LSAAFDVDSQIQEPALISKNRNFQINLKSKAADRSVRPTQASDAGLLPPDPSLKFKRLSADVVFDRLAFKAMAFSAAIVLWGQSGVEANGGT